jgi:hypothetical protein
MISIFLDSVENLHKNEANGSPKSSGRACPADRIFLGRATLPYILSRLAAMQENRMAQATVSKFDKMSSGLAELTSYR